MVAVIRRLNLGEGLLYRQIRLASLSDAPTAFGSTYASALERSLASWQEQADSTARGSERATFVAFSKEKPVGIAALYRSEAERQTGELLQVWLDPEYRAQGIMNDLLDILFQWGLENQFQKIAAEVAKENKIAIKFYQKCGFKMLPKDQQSSSDQNAVLTKTLSEF